MSVDPVSRVYGPRKVALNRREEERRVLLGQGSFRNQSPKGVATGLPLVLQGHGLEAETHREP